MKILHVISSINPESGGVAQALRTIINQLNEYKIESEVVSIDCDGNTFLNGCTFKVYPIGPAKTAWGYAPNLKQWLIKNIRNYDCVLVHGLWQYQSLAVYQALTVNKEFNKKVFVMPHGMLDPYFQKAKERRLKAFRNYLIWHFVEYRLINSCNGLLFTCETEKILARDTFNNYYPKEEIVVGLGVDAPPEYHKGMTKAFENKLGCKVDNYWLFISRINGKKGVDLLIKAYHKLKVNTSFALPKLIIAGPGLDTEYGQKMLELASDDNDIYFPGMLIGDAKWGAFYDAELFILPSHQENFGIAVVEALACNTPVLISNKINIWREIANSQAGIVIEDSENALFDALLTQTKKTEIDNKNCRKAYEMYFTTTITSKKLYDLVNVK